MSDLLASPQLGEDVENFVGAAAALAELDPGDAKLVGVPADPNAELEAAARQHLQAGDLLRHEHRVADWRDQDAGADRDPRGAAGRERQVSSGDSHAVP